MAVNGADAPTPGPVLPGGIFERHRAGIGGKLNIIGVEEHDQVAQAQKTGNPARPLRNLLLHTAIRNKGKGFVGHPFAKPRAQKAFRNGGADRADMPLAQRPGGVLHAAAHLQLRMPGRGAAPLAEVLQLFQRVESAERQHGVEHRRHVARIQEKPVSHMPARIRGIITQELGVENIDEVGAAHRPARMTGFGFFHHGGGKNADIVSGPISKRIMHVVRRELFASSNNYQALSTGRHRCGQGPRLSAPAFRWLRGKRFSQLQNRFSGSGGRGESV